MATISSYYVLQRPRAQRGQRPASGESVETRLAIQVSASCNHLERCVQVVSHLLRTRQGDIRVVIPGPTAARASFSLTSARPVKRLAKKEA
jgi:hypothetical protein